MGLLATKPIESASNQLTTDQLLQIAKLEGGSVGEIAEELTHPERSILATMSEKAKGIFGEFVDLLTTGNQVVAGALSPDMTIDEAVKKNVSASEVIFGSVSKSASGTEKVGQFASRVAVDTLLDPLTYVTFGAGRGLVGLTKGMEMYAGEKIAAKAGVKVGDTVVLSEKGERYADEYIAAKQNGLRQSYLRREEKKLLDSGKSLDEVKKILDELDNKVTDSQVAETFGKRFSRTDGAIALSRMLEKNPALAETYLDKGGIKFFGKTILEGQRIASTIRAIPGFTELDTFTKPLRYTAASLFSNSYTATGRKPQMFIDIEQKFKDLAESRKNELLLRVPEVYSKLKITDNEAKFINAAIERGLMPRDKRAADVWKIANGIEPENPVIRDEVWKAMNFDKAERRATLKELRRSGIPVSDLNGYGRHLISKENFQRKVFRTSSKQEAKSQLFAKYNTLVDEQGNRIPVEFDKKLQLGETIGGRVSIGGKLEKREFTVFHSEKTIKQIKEFTEKRTKELSKALSDTFEEISNLTTGIKGSIAKKVSSEILKRTETLLAIDPKDVKLITDKIAELIPEKDIDKVISKTLARSYKNGVKFSNGQSISSVDIDKLAQDLIMAKPEAKAIASEINKLLATKPQLKHQGLLKDKPVKKIDPEVAKLAEEIKKKIADTKKSVLQKTLDTKGLEDLIRQMVAITSKNPKGLRVMISSIIKNKQLSRDISDELSDIQRAAELDIDEAASLRGKIVDKTTGKEYTRVRIFTDEAKEFGVDFQDNSLLVTLAGSYEAVKVSTARYFTRDMARSFGLPASKAPAGWRPVSNAGFDDLGTEIGNFRMNKKGEEVYFPPDIADNIEGLVKSFSSDEAAGKVGEYYDKLQNYFKASVTSIYPAFHGRNAISNVMQMFTAIGGHVFNPAMHVKVQSVVNMNSQFKKMQTMLGTGKITPDEFTAFTQKHVFTDKSGYKWSLGELRSVIHKNVIAFHPRNLGMVDQTMLDKDHLTELQHRLFPASDKDRVYQNMKKVNPFSTQNIAFKTGFAVGQAIEDHSKLMVFMSYLKETGDIQQASKMTKEVLFDYANLTDFERRFLRRIIPFYTYSRKNIELQVKTLLSNPARTAGIVRSVYTIGDVMGNEGLTEEERKLLPEWMRYGHAAVLSRENNEMTILSNFGIPLEQALGHLDPHTLLSMTSPLLKIPVEKMSGYSFFYGRPISEVTNAAAFSHPASPGWIKDYIGFTEVTGVNKKTGEEFTYYTALRPERMHTVMSMPPTSRVWSIMRTAQDKDISEQAKLMSYLIGMNPETFDMEIEAQRTEDRNRRELEDLLKQAGIGYKLNRYIIPKEQKEELGFEE